MENKPTKNALTVILIAVSILITPVSIYLAYVGMATMPTNNGFVGILLILSIVVPPPIVIYRILLRVKKRKAYIIFHYIYAFAWSLFGGYMFYLFLLALEMGGGLAEAFVSLLSFAVSIVTAISFTIALIIFYIKKRKKQMRQQMTSPS